MNQLRGYISILILAVGFLTWHYLAMRSKNGVDTRGLIALSQEHLEAKNQQNSRSESLESLESTTSYRSKDENRTLRELLSINLNQADTTTLKRVYGIGSVYAKRIVEYRKELGGYHSVEQLQEIKGMFRENYERIYKNFFIDTLLISKIYINFAPHSELLQHPYFTKGMADRIVKAQKKGGYFTSYQELIDNDILLKEEALRVAPYLAYDTIRSEKN